MMEEFVDPTAEQPADKVPTLVGKNVEVEYKGYKGQVRIAEGILYEMAADYVTLNSDGDFFFIIPINRVVSLSGRTGDKS